MNMNNSIQNNADYIPLPQHLTKYCVITIHFMLLSAIVTLILGYKVLALLFLCLYIIGFSYWRKPEYNSILKKIDVFFIFITCCLIMYYAFKFKEKYQRLYIILFLIICVIVIINEALYRFKIVGMFDNDNTEPVFSNFDYFTLDYTYPNTIEREKCCQFSVFVHCFFSHILGNLVWLYCLIGNTYF